MNLLEQLIEHLYEMNVKWHLCGGFAIDAYLDYQTRKHKDLDITIHFNQMNECVNYLKSKGWEIGVPVGQGRFVSVEFALEHKELSFDNIWCYKKDAKFIKVEKIDGPFKYMTFMEREQINLDFIEVLFNKYDQHMFYYQKNESITREIKRAFINKGSLSILSPEVVLLYKARNYENPNYQHDFEQVIPTLEKERYAWFIQAMKRQYPKGHLWIEEQISIHN